MKHLLVSFLCLTAITSAARGATLAIVPDKSFYYIEYGETITLTVIGDDAGATTFGVQGRIDFNGALVNVGTVTQTQLAGHYGRFTLGTPPGLDNGGSGSFQFLFTQTSGAPQEATNLPGVLATVTLIAQATGVVNVTWHASAVDGFGLEFFGLTDAPGTSFTIISCDGCSGPGVPEPATAALLALGLIALAALPRGKVT